jgi:hypothetical protein
MSNTEEHALEEFDWETEREDEDDWLIEEVGKDNSSKSIGIRRKDAKGSRR